MAPVLGYWDIRGLAQPIRLLLNYIGKEYEEKTYSIGPAPDYNSDCWTSAKSDLGLAFPNLPYWIDGDTKVSQSHAILKLLAREHDLCPTSPSDMVRCDVIEHQLEDFIVGLAIVCYASLMQTDHETRKTEYLKSLPDKLKQYSEFLGDRQWFVGEKLTFVDFIAYDQLDIHRMFAPGCMDPYKNLTDYLARFEALPPIQKYMQSDKFMKRPIFNKMADWTG